MIPGPPRTISSSKHEPFAICTDGLPHLDSNSSIATPEKYSLRRALSPSDQEFLGSPAAAATAPDSKELGAREESVPYEPLGRRSGTRQQGTGLPCGVSSLRVPTECCGIRRVCRMSWVCERRAH